MTSILLATQEALHNAESQGRLLLTVAEAARSTSLSRTTLYHEMAAGRLKSVLVGRARRIRAGDLDEYVGQLSDTGAA